MRKQLQKFKIAAACLLLLSFFLPISSCSYMVPLEAGMDNTRSQSEEEKAERRTVLLYPREYVELREVGSWLNLLGFTWPFFIIVFHSRFRGRGARIFFPSAGTILSAMTGVVVYAWADVGKPLIGAYTGWCAALALFLIYGTELLREIRDRKKGENRN